MRDISVIRAEIEDLQHKIDLIEDLPEEFQTDEIWAEHADREEYLSQLWKEYNEAAKKQLL